MASSDDQLDMAVNIVTPENISFRYQLAGPFRRLVAFAADLIIRVVTFYAVAILLAIIGASGMLDGELGIAVIVLLWFAMEWFYGGLFETFWNGQTLGKRLLGIRVLGVDGEPISGWQAMLRNILRTVDMMPLLPGAALGGMVPLPTFLFGLLTPVMNARFQRIGDLVAGTMVVVEEKITLLEPAKFADARVAQLAALIPARFTASQSLAKALAAYAERRSYFMPARRQEIAQHLARPLLARFGMPADTSYDLFLCALYYRTFVTDRPDEGLLPNAYQSSGGWPHDSSRRMGRLPATPPIAGGRAVPNLSTPPAGSPATPPRKSPLPVAPAPSGSPFRPQAGGPHADDAGSTSREPDDDTVPENLP